MRENSEWHHSDPTGVVEEGEDLEEGEIEGEAADEAEIRALIEKQKKLERKRKRREEREKRKQQEKIERLLREQEEEESGVIYEEESERTHHKKKKKRSHESDDETVTSSSRKKKKRSDTPPPFVPPGNEDGSGDSSRSPPPDLPIPPSFGRSLHQGHPLGMGYGPASDYDMNMPPDMDMPHGMDMPPGTDHMDMPHDMGPMDMDPMMSNWEQGPGGWDGPPGMSPRGPPPMRGMSWGGMGPRGPRMGMRLPPPGLQPRDFDRTKPPRERTCMYWLQGYCNKGSRCPFAHGEHTPQKIDELCKFYAMRCCAKKDKCLYMHDTFPCKYYHTGAECPDNRECLFSHQPLNPTTKALLLKFLESAPKDILGDIPRMTMDNARAVVDAIERKHISEHGKKREGSENPTDREREYSEDRNRERSRERERSKDEDQSKEEGQSVKSDDMERQRERRPSTDRERALSIEAERHRSKERGKSPVKRREGDRESKERERDRSKERVRNRSRERDRERSRERGRERSREREREHSRDRDRTRDRDRSRERERSRGRDRERSRERERPRKKDVDRRRGSSERRFEEDERSSNRGGGRISPNTEQKGSEEKPGLKSDPFNLGVPLGDIDMRHMPTTLLMDPITSSGNILPPVFAQIKDEPPVLKTKELIVHDTVKPAVLKEENNQKEQPAPSESPVSNRESEDTLFSPGGLVIAEDIAKEEPSQISLDEPLEMDIEDDDTPGNESALPEEPLTSSTTPLNHDLEPTATVQQQGGSTPVPSGDEDWYSSDDEDQSSSTKDKTTSAEPQKTVVESEKPKKRVSLQDVMKKVRERVDNEKEKENTTQQPTAIEAPSPMVNNPLAAFNLNDIPDSVVHVLSTALKNPVLKSPAAMDPRINRQSSIGSPRQSTPPLSSTAGKPSPPTPKDSDLRQIFPPLLDQDLRFGPLDSDLRRGAFRFEKAQKQITSYTPCQEINGSITAHPAIDWALIPIEGLKAGPNYSGLPRVVYFNHRNDPRLERVLLSMKLEDGDERTLPMPVSPSLSMTSTFPPVDPPQLPRDPRSKPPAALSMCSLPGPPLHGEIASPPQLPPGDPRLRDPRRRMSPGSRDVDHRRALPQSPNPYGPFGPAPISRGQ
ncbi:unnamed protein product [Cyprideis torosa]|uniref:Uncharacterized protein n=1 Tax=Cyprideis torosa TaxID=163714 RepID=A0A7R8WAP7_9CRUS|nr:unnamed protein product [Cyprideis torosa]CAG0889916.1 unnamed protein product [Cyprideis torosa]